MNEEQKILHHAHQLPPCITTGVVDTTRHYHCKALVIVQCYQHGTSIDPVELA